MVYIGCMAVAADKKEEIPQVASRVEQEKTMVVWKAKARPFKNRKGKDFMLVPLVIAGLLFLILLTAGEWVLMAAVAAVVFVYYVWSTVPPHEVEYAVTNRGLRMEGRLYEWWQFSRWWWGEKWGEGLLMLEMPGSMFGRMSIPIGDTDKKKLEEAMGKMLLMEKPEDTSLDRASRWLAAKFPME